MSRNRRPQGGWAPYMHGDWREGLLLKRQLLRHDFHNEGRHDSTAGDCAACGWITARANCPICGAAILDEAQP